MTRIIYYSKGDLAWMHSLEQINNYFNQHKHVRNPQTIDDVLERQHIIYYLEDGYVYKDWTEQDILHYRALLKDLKKNISQYFDNLTWDHVIDIFDKISFSYTETFWYCVNKHEFLKKIADGQFSVITNKRNFRLEEILYCKKIIGFLNEEIRQCIMSFPKYAEILLDYFEADHDRTQQEKFFPASLTLSDREILISDYLDHDDTHPNYLHLIVNNKDSPHLRISDRIRLKAKRLATRINDELLNSEYAISIKKSACLSEDQEDTKKMILRNDELILSYSKKRLSEKTDVDTLLKNFRTIFEYLDFQGCIEFVSKSSNIDGLEHLFMRSKNDFMISSSFSESSMEGMMRFEIYKYFLDESNFKLEDIIEEYVNRNLNTQYNIDHFKLHLPGQDTSFLEKIRLIVPEFESLIKQYKLYVEDDIIDFELMQVSTKTSKISSIPSMLEKKYAYPVGDECQKLKHIFFDSHSYLFDYKKYGDRYNSFYDVLRKENININDFDEGRRAYVISLTELGHLKIDEDGYLSFVNRNTFVIIGYLKIYDVISYWYFPKEIRDELDRMNQAGMVKFSDKLFTTAEQEYFDYYLNNRFSNGLWLRNKYVHATNSHDKVEQETDYKILLKLLILVVLKIEDDLNLARSMFSSKNSLM